MDVFRELDNAFQDGALFIHHNTSQAEVCHTYSDTHEILSVATRAEPLHSPALCVGAEVRSSPFHTTHTSSH